MASRCGRKARYAERVIEILDYFNEERRAATVMDIARRFDRPQSSTSELLTTLIDLGLVHKDESARLYSLTPRSAMLANIAQPPLIGKGHITRIVDRLSAQTKLSVAILSVVGTNCQIISWRDGDDTSSMHGSVHLPLGQKTPLIDTAVGWLLLSALTAKVQSRLLSRIHPGAAADRPFGMANVPAPILDCQDRGSSSGALGFDCDARIVAILLPQMPSNKPLAIGLAYSPLDDLDDAMLLRTLINAVGAETNHPEPTTDCAAATISPKHIMEKAHG